MYNLDNLKVLGSGATATVYLLDGERIIKVFNSLYLADAVQYEAHLSEEISKTGIIAPKFHYLTTVENKNAIVSDYIDGQLLLTRLLNSPVTACFGIMKQMADSQKLIHRTECTGITSQYDRFSYLINNTGLNTSKKKIILEILQEMITDTAVCHGDFHPGNIIADENGVLYTIDWMNCYYGNCLGDAVRTYLTLVSPFDPFNLPVIKKFFFKIYRLLLGKIYLREYCKNTDIKKRDIKKWIPIIAAGRLADNIPDEDKWLLRLIDSNMKYLTASSA
ncbi:MAG: aminoglycoside phosphotransferase family protein [Spirochaetes bacterium]|nr:aminoglycoside phosphotransferase family protein [Spirochaetota bacterium]